MQESLQAMIAAFQETVAEMGHDFDSIPGLHEMLDSGSIEVDDRKNDDSDEDDNSDDDDDKDIGESKSDLKLQDKTNLTRKTSDGHV